MIMLVRALALCLVLLAPVAAAAPPPPSGSPRIGLALSGGGARGLAHIGVLRVLEELHVPVHAIAGTSMGAIVGGLYASGMRPDEMAEAIAGIDWARAFDDRPARDALPLRRKQEDYDLTVRGEIGLRDGEWRFPRGAIAGAGFQTLLRRLSARATGITDFDALPIPFRAVATDLVIGREFVFAEGDLATALRASMSVPGAFAPIEVGGTVLGDGGIVKNLPIDIARSMGVDVVIAVNIGTPLGDRSMLDSAFGVTQQSIHILMEQNVRAQLNTLTDQDILLSPDLGRLTAVEFTRGVEAIAAGEQAARAAADTLRRLAIPTADYAAWRAAMAASTTTPARLDFVRIEGNVLTDAPALGHGLRTRAGEPPTAAGLNADVTTLLGTGDFARVDYRLQDEAGTHGVVFSVEEKSWGPHYFGAGFSLATDFRTRGVFNLLLGHRRRWVNDWGGEWRNRLQFGETRRIASEFYQPLGAASPYFVAPYADSIRRNLVNYAGGAARSESVIGADRVGLDVGVAFGRGGELRLGLSHARLSAERIIGDGAPRFVGREIGPSLRFAYDDLDAANFPSRGHRINASAFAANTGLGSDADYTRLHLDSEYARSLGRNTLALGIELAGFRDADRVGYNDFALGGFQRLSAYRPNEISGNYLALARAAVYRRIGEFAPLARGVYAGASLELGNAWAKQADIRGSDLRHSFAIFVGVDTVVGPVYLAVGAARGGHRAVYLRVGRP